MENYMNRRTCTWNTFGTKRIVQITCWRRVTALGIRLTWRALIRGATEWSLLWSTIAIYSAIFARFLNTNTPERARRVLKTGYTSVCSYIADRVEITALAILSAFYAFPSWLATYFVSFINAISRCYAFLTLITGQIADWESQASSSNTVQTRRAADAPVVINQALWVCICIAFFVSQTLYTGVPVPIHVTNWQSPYTWALGWVGTLQIVPEVKKNNLVLTLLPIFCEYLFSRNCRLNSRHSLKMNKRHQTHLNTLIDIEVTKRIGIRALVISVTTNDAFFCRATERKTTAIGISSASCTTICCHVAVWSLGTLWRTVLVRETISADSTCSITDKGVLTRVLICALLACCCLNIAVRILCILTVSIVQALKHKKTSR